MTKPVIVVGLGANLPSERFGAPRKTLEAAIEALEGLGVRVVARSRWYSSAAYPASDQPRYVNAVISVETKLSPEALLELLHDIERNFGRKRTIANAAREIDLDLLAFGDLIRAESAPILPHPRLPERAFVLRPLCDIAPEWRHPQLGQSASELAEAVDDDDLRLCDEANNEPKTA